MSEQGGHASAPQLGRVTPWELIFAGDRFEREVLPATLAEAQSQATDLADPDAFALLGTVGRLLRELLVTTDPATTIRPLAALLFQAFQFWRFASRVYALEPELLEHLTSERVHAGDWMLVPPHPAGYVQLPRHRVWSRIDEVTPPEPVDGFFWTMIGRDDPAAPPFRRIDVLLVLGLHAGRAGLSVVEASSLLPSQPAGHWADIAAREGGQDFANVLPGGELSRLYALTHVAEVLKLVSRFFFFVATHPAAVGAAAPPAPAGAAASSLSIRRVLLPAGAADG